LAGYFALSPFPAARRVMGIVVVMTLLTGRLASRSCGDRAGKTLMHAIALGNVVLGFMFYGVDLHDAWTEKRAVQQVAILLRPVAGETVWYAGHWGFQFYAERAGMKPVVPGESRLRQGDWLVLPDERIHQPSLELTPDALRLLHVHALEDPLPLRTISCYYGGRTPLQHQEGARLTVRRYRVTAAFIPARRSD